MPRFCDNCYIYYSDECANCDGLGVVGYAERRCIYCWDGVEDHWRCENKDCPNYDEEED
jgi:hypothetical protein